MSDPRTHINRDFDRTTCIPEDQSPPPDPDWFLTEESTACEGLDAFSTDDYKLENITDTECASAAAGELFDPAVYEIEQVVGGDCEDCCCCGCTCCCGKGYWSEYTFTIAGVTEGTVNPCPECLEENGSFTVGFTQDCQWETAEQSGQAGCAAGGDVGAVWNLGCANGTWQLASAEAGCGEDIYVIVEDFCECGGTFPLVPGSEAGCLSCDTHPGSVTITPAGVWVSCGKPEPECSEGLMAMRAAPAMRAARVASPRAVNAGGIGAELKKVFAEVGFKAKAGCGCDKMARKMNAWGVEGCQEHREEILAWLREQQAKAGWLAKAKAGVLAAVSGIAVKLNPLDPAPGLFDEAIRRFEAQRSGANDSDTGTPDTSK